jgi:signal transduction histidine kinase/CheY-like chemotaxis protein
MNELIELAKRLMTADWALASWIVALVSAWTLVWMCAYLSRATDKPHFTRWTTGWVFFSIAQAAEIGVEGMPNERLLHAVQMAAVGISAVCLFGGCVQIMQRKEWGRRLAYAVAPILLWSAVSAYGFHSQWWTREPVFMLLAGACVYIGLQYFRDRKRSHAASILSGGFFLWALHLAAAPFLGGVPMLLPVGHAISAALTLAIAIGIILKEEAELSDERYRGVLASVNEAVFIVDLWTMEILDANDAAHQLTRHSVEKLMTMRMGAVCPDLQSDRRNLLENRNLINAVFKPYNEFHILRADGDPVVCEGDTNLIHWRKLPVLHIKVREVDKGRKLGQMMRRAEKLSSLGQLIAGVAHELNNPLAVVTGYAQLMSKQAIQDEKTRTTMQKILHESERASKIVRDLLSFARPCEPQMTAVDVNHLVRSVMEVRERDLRAQGIELETRLAANLPWTQADPVQIEQVLNNLVTNAVHAMLETAHGPRKLTVTTESNGPCIRIGVADTGPGIPLSIREKIFEPFFTTKPPGKGTGLGLSISHTILEEHHGHLRLETEVGHGATFTIELPILEVEAPTTEPATTNSPEQVPTAVSMLPRRVLVVDDEPGIREVLQELLMASGYTVDTAADGCEALKRIENNQFDLVISDLCMPGLDGPELHRRIRDKDEGLARRMIFLTGDTVSPKSRTFLEQTGNRWLCKPFNLSDVEDAVRTLLEQDLLTTLTGNGVHPRPAGIRRYHPATFVTRG